MFQEYEGYAKFSYENENLDFSPLYLVLLGKEQIKRLINLNGFIYVFQLIYSNKKFIVNIIQIWPKTIPILNYDFSNLIIPRINSRYLPYSINMKDGYITLCLCGLKNHSKNSTNTNSIIILHFNLNKMILEFNNFSKQNPQDHFIIDDLIEFNMSESIDIQNSTTKEYLISYNADDTPLFYNNTPINETINDQIVQIQELEESLKNMTLYYHHCSKDKFILVIQRSYDDEIIYIDINTKNKKKMKIPNIIRGLQLTNYLISSEKKILFIKHNMDGSFLDTNYEIICFCKSHNQTNALTKINNIMENIGIIVNLEKYSEYLQGQTNQQFIEIIDFNKFKLKYLISEKLRSFYSVKQFNEKSQEFKFDVFKKIILNINGFKKKHFLKFLEMNY